MRTLHKIGAMVLILFVLFYIAMPFLIIGLPLPFFEIVNKDNVTHGSTVEIFDPYNGSIFKERYDVAPGEHVSQSKPPVLVIKTHLLENECGCCVTATNNDN